MGATYLSGPVYGAYGLLAVASMASFALSQTDVEFAQIDIPADEDWIIMKVTGYVDLLGTTLSYDVEDDGVSILSAAITGVDNDAVEGTVVKTGGEAGALVAGGSVLTVDYTSGATTASEDGLVHIWGFIRKKSPTPSDV